MNKAVEIFKAWKISFNPNNEQTKLALSRLEICADCEFKVDKPWVHCGICKCPLDKKIYSPNIGACPKGKWDSVDKDWEKNYNK